MCEQFGKHIQAHKEFRFGDLIMMQKPHVRNCPIENGVCRRCLKDIKPYAPCQRTLSFKFIEKQEKFRVTKLAFLTTPQNDINCFKLQ